MSERDYLSFIISRSLFLQIQLRKENDDSFDLGVLDLTERVLRHRQKETTVFRPLLLNLGNVDPRLKGRIRDGVRTPPDSLGPKVVPSHYEVLTVTL